MNRPQQEVCEKCGLSHWGKENGRKGVHKLGDLSVAVFKKALLFQAFRSNNLEGTQFLNDFSRSHKKTTLKSPS